MNIDILNMGFYEPNEQAIDIALPVLAVECEVTSPLENFLDAYEETVLKLVSLGLSGNGIAKTLNATESLIDEILTNLEWKRYVEREKGKPWMLTDDGKKYLDGTISDRSSSESQYGFMFINAIKKEVLPFFYLGDIGKISLFRGQSLPLKLTVEGDEKLTFKPIEVKQSKLRKAYKSYFKNLQVRKDLDEGIITKEEAIDIFADLDSFDEAEEEETLNECSETNSDSLKSNMFIRPLKKAPEKLYLRMRIIIDPSYPGGYRAESPFNFEGIDNNFFLRQIQWLEQSENAYIDGEILQDFLYREICKLSPSYKTSEKDFKVFVLERMPLLSLSRSKLPFIYEDMERIYFLMQRQNCLLEKENIVNNLGRCVVEGLFNTYFRAIDLSKLSQIKEKAIDEVSTYGHVTYKKRLCRASKLDEDTLKWVSNRYINTILQRIDHTFGNSIMEKFINMLVIDYHLGNSKINRFLSNKNLGETYNLIDKLNRIRRKVSHDTDECFTNEDYRFYMENVFDLINSLLEAFREDR